MSREIKFEFVFHHAESKETIISAGYTIEQLLDTHLEEIQEKHCDCDCQPSGESSYKDCNCLDYYVDFELIAKRQYTGLKDKNDTHIYEGDIVKYLIGDNGSYRTGEIVFVNGYFAVLWKNSLWENIRHLLNEFNSLLEIIGNIHQNPELLKGDQ